MVPILGLYYPFLIICALIDFADNIHLNYKY